MKKLILSILAVSGLYSTSSFAAQAVNSCLEFTGYNKYSQAERGYGFYDDESLKADQYGTVNVILESETANNCIYSVKTHCNPNADRALEVCHISKMEISKESQISTRPQMKLNSKVFKGSITYPGFYTPLFVEKILVQSYLDNSILRVERLGTADSGGGYTGGPSGTYFLFFSK